MHLFKKALSLNCLALATIACAQQGVKEAAPIKPKHELPMEVEKPSPFTPEQRGALLSLIEEFVKTNPQVIKQSLEKLIAAEALEQERKEKAIAASLIKANDAAIFKNPSIPVLGNPSGSRVLAIFVDPYCGWCHKLLEDLKQLAQEDSQLKVLIHDVAFLGKSSEFAVKALLAAKTLGKDEAFREALKTLKAPLEPSSLATFVKPLGIDGKTFETVMNQEQVSVVYETNMKLVNALKVDGTPTLIHGLEMIQGYLEPDVLQQKLGILVRVQDPSKDGIKTANDVLQEKNEQNP